MIYVTVDLHGFPLEGLKTLLEKAGFTAQDELYVLGDVIDRGPEGITLLRWMMCQPNVELILGNHEEMMLESAFLLEEITQRSLDALTPETLDALANWLANGGAPTISALRALPAEDRAYIFDYLRDAPLFEIVSAGDRHFLLTHSGLGGFSSEKEIDDYGRDELLWNRPRLTDRYYENVTTVFGHTPTVNYGQEFAGKAIVTETWINIDTGAGWEFAPMLLRLDDLQEFYL